MLPIVVGVIRLPLSKGFIFTHANYLEVKIISCKLTFLFIYPYGNYFEKTMIFVVGAVYIQNNVKCQ